MWKSVNKNKYECLRNNLLSSKGISAYQQVCLVTIIPVDLIFSQPFCCFSPIIGLNLFFPHFFSLTPLQLCTIKFFRIQCPYCTILPYPYQYFYIIYTLNWLYPFLSMSWIIFRVYKTDKYNYWHNFFFGTAWRWQ